MPPVYWRCVVDLWVKLGIRFLFTTLLLYFFKKTALGVIASNIKFLRERKGLSQTQLSEVLALTQSAISSYEKEKSQPLPDGLVKLANYFDISIDDLLLKDLNSQDSDITTRKELEVELAHLRRENADLRELVETQRQLIEVLMKKE